MLELTIAWRFIRAKRREGFISVVSGFSLAGITLGVATLIVVMAVMNGFRHDLFEKLLGVNGHARAYVSYDATPADVDLLKSEILKDERVDYLTPVIQGEALATNAGKARGSIIRGIDGNDFIKHKFLNAALNDKNFDDKYSQIVNNLPTAIVGYRLADRLGVEKGSKITLVAPGGVNSPFGVMPKFQSFHVLDTINTGLYDADNAYIFTAINNAKRFLARTGDFDYILVMLNNPDEAGQVALDLKSMNNVTGSLSWQQVSSGFYNALQVERNVMFVILTLIIVVAAFNVISGQIMLVSDKSMQVGLMRAIGLSRSRIWKVFLVTGAFIGVIGSIIGTVLGVLVATNIEGIRRAVEKLIGTELFAAEIYYITRLPAQLETSNVVLVVSMALGITFLSALFPAWRAARLDPAEVLKDG